MWQVCHKWLKDRRERVLDRNDIRTYCLTVTALKLTIDIQEAINALYPKIEEQSLPKLASKGV